MLIYTIAIRFYHFIARIISPFNKKALQFTSGRKNLLKKIEHDLLNKNERRIWVHAASLGEFEQGRPVIEKLKKEYPEHKIILTFFSPSGYELRKDYGQADYIYYLPLDSKKNAIKFIRLVNPELAIFVKYEFWLNYLNELHKQHIPTILISGIFRPDQHFFKWYGKIFFRTLFYYQHLFLQNEASLKLLNKKGITSCSRAGDTRFDRVIEIAQNPASFPEIESFVSNNLCLLCGSTWAEDEQFLIPAYAELKTHHPGAKLIIAPHNIGQININQLLSIIKSNGHSFSVKIYTQWDKTGTGDILIIDTIGMLSSLYQYADIAYIGGGFGSGIHNILEALVYGIPVIFGPNHKKFNEASEALNKQIAFCFEKQAELNELLLNLSDKNIRLETGKKSSAYVEENAGSTDRILEHIRKEILRP